MERGLVLLVLTVAALGLTDARSPPKPLPLPPGDPTPPPNILENTKKLNESCLAKGKPKYLCSGFGVDISCPPDSGVCECRAGYEPFENGTCRVKSPGHKCNVTADCTGAWTECVAGQCKCIKGFRRRDREIRVICNPVAMHCPGGVDPVKVTDPKLSGVQSCTVKLDRETGEFVNDTCPVGSSCNYWSNTQTDRHRYFGHCCPKPKKATTPVCPVGDAFPGVCPDWSTVPQDAPFVPPTNETLCPFGNEFECTKDRLCCPRACRSANTFFNYNGVCYDRVILDQPCEIHSQCLPGSDCIDGTCQCKKGFTRVSSTYCLPPGEPNLFG